MQTENLQNIVTHIAVSLILSLIVWVAKPLFVPIVAQLRPVTRTLAKPANPRTLKDIVDATEVITTGVAINVISDPVVNTVYSSSSTQATTSSINSEVNSNIACICNTPNSEQIFIHSAPNNVNPANAYTLKQLIEVCEREGGRAPVSWENLIGTSYESIKHRLIEPLSRNYMAFTTQGPNFGFLCFK